MAFPSKDFSKTQDKCETVIETLSQVIVGKDDLLKYILTGFLADGHILIEDVPGVAKTMIANSFAQVMNLDFGRVQFLPDLLPGDITGGYIYNAGKNEFEFKPGPIFTGLLLADEVNRGTPKTQSALLEAMQERTVTVEGSSYDLTKPFLVIATQNPIEFDGTYPLPEAQLDRFIMRLEVGYPTVDEETEILDKRAHRAKDEVELPTIVSREEFLEMQEQVEEVFVHGDILNYISRLVHATRDLDKVEVGASPRGSLAIFKLSRAVAMMNGRDFVTPEDVKEVFIPALIHRIILTPEARIEKWDLKDMLAQVINKVSPPSIDGRRDD
ncbi:AAA family ATPase [Natranaerobius thermophilus]|uniref:ATPase associated with various cellular activities AAA_3 n=1 Tax=Natranaerobius thermophilus (strain ATCC BAA-1301 / DSM 18059 / JW/NM-WN-LF) TaxID=457570 RepID=B2A7G4_NATTJ|nr:MoxR family ATPase [Natranaerobius thermophilus]ACB85673.1 ATPase associated with various cellular activities AAA_3 [Natranaerobius thermophilus JW/NM-WN-LF]